jgi:hypothetical protein
VIQRYTVEEANELLPYLAPALVELREKWERAEQTQQARARASKSNGGPSHDEDDADVLERVAELMGRIQNWGLYLRDVRTGLVDFPWATEGEDSFLCWRLGESEVSHWHPAGEGFGGRKPLPD